MLTAAQTHYLRLKRLSEQAAARALRLWMLGLDPAALDDSAQALLDGLVRIVVAGQLTAAAAADPYTDAALTEQGISTDRTGSIIPAALAGVASDGRSLATLVLEPLVRVKTALGEGLTLTDALTQGLHSLNRIVSTQVTDAGRVATGAALVARPPGRRRLRAADQPSELPAVRDPRRPVLPVELRLPATSALPLPERAHHRAPRRRPHHRPDPGVSVRAGHRTVGRRRQGDR